MEIMGYFLEGFYKVNTLGGRGCSLAYILRYSRGMCNGLPLHVILGILFSLVKVRSTRTESQTM